MVNRNKQKKQPSRKRNGKQVSFDFKLSVIDEINNGRISVNYAAKKYNISRSTIQYWMQKLSNYGSKAKHVNKDLEIKKLKERNEALEFIKEFQQDMIVEFERITGEELSKKFLPEHLANEIQRKKKKLTK
jgi:transposase-like protein